MMLGDIRWRRMCWLTLFEADHSALRIMFLLSTSGARVLIHHLEAFIMEYTNNTPIHYFTSLSQCTNNTPTQHFRSVAVMSRVSLMSGRVTSRCSTYADIHGHQWSWDAHSYLLNIYGVKCLGTIFPWGICNSHGNPTMLWSYRRNQVPVAIWLRKQAPSDQVLFSHAIKSICSWWLLLLVMG